MLIEFRTAKSVAAKRKLTHFRHRELSKYPNVDYDGADDDINFPRMANAATNLFFHDHYDGQRNGNAIAFNCWSQMLIVIA